jgi:hypothetical protein
VPAAFRTGPRRTTARRWRSSRPPIRQPRRPASCPAPISSPHRAMRRSRICVSATWCAPLPARRAPFAGSAPGPMAGLSRGATLPCGRFVSLPARWPMASLPGIYGSVKNTRSSSTVCWWRPGCS